MESITNYNVLLLHGAYGHYKDKDKKTLQGFAENKNLSSAYDASAFLGNANIGHYTEKPEDKKRLNHWLSKEIFEEPEWLDEEQGVHNSCIYHWRSFSEPPNSSVANAVELGDRTWNKDGKFGKRRALVEEAQEVKGSFYDSVAKKIHLWSSSPRFNPPKSRPLPSARVPLHPCRPQYGRRGGPRMDPEQRLLPWRGGQGDNTR